MLRDTRHALLEDEAGFGLDRPHSQNDPANSRSFTTSAIRHSARGLSCDTSVKTLWGEKALREIKVGEQVLTRDNGYQTVRWVGLIELPVLSERIVIRAGALGRMLPCRDLVVSGKQRILSGTGVLKNLCNTKEALIRARDLLHLDGIEICEAEQGPQGRQILFNRHELILANDVWTESFQPDSAFLEMLPLAQRQALQALCPKLTRAGSRRAFPAARTQMRLEV